MPISHVSIDELICDLLPIYYVCLGEKWQLLNVGALKNISIIFKIYEVFFIENI
jgi:hypothetical protein